MNKLLTSESWTQGWIRFWAQADGVSHAIAYLLLLMSIVSWFFILSKSLAARRIRYSAQQLDQFWGASTLHEGVALLQRIDGDAIFAPLAHQALHLQSKASTLAAGLSAADLSTRLLRQQIHLASQRLERGLTILASIGTTAPFIGLLGTVWGIYHALTNLSSAGTAQIDKLAGPVGEALVMTGLGLVVAIPAVLAYNGFGRLNRLRLNELDGFAHDLQAYVLRNPVLDNGETSTQ